MSDGVVKNVSSSTPLKIGCISTDKVNTIGQSKGYFTKIAGLHDQDDCLKKAAALGVLCNLDSKQPCQYIARPSSLTSGNQGDCYLIGHDGKPLDFNKTLYDNVTQNNCQNTGDLTKILSVLTTDPSGYQEEQKKVATQEINVLRNDISQKKSDLSKKELYITCLQTGKDYATCLKEEAKNNIELQRATEMKQVLLANKNFEQVKGDHKMYSNLHDQKTKRGAEVIGDLAHKKSRLQRLNETILTKTKLIDYNNDIYQENNQTVYYLNLSIFLLVIVALGLIFYHNFDLVSGAVSNIGNAVNKMNLNMPNLGLNSFSDVKLRNLKNFSF